MRIYEGPTEVPAQRDRNKGIGLEELNLPPPGALLTIRVRLRGARHPGRHAGPFTRVSSTTDIIKQLLNTVIACQGGEVVITRVFSPRPPARLPGFLHC
ncbi:MAG: hypothetical protein H7125_17340 [Proteobacteria bacterium]|nr:hypothetical protein [Burkholderiales bacterium]